MTKNKTISSLAQDALKCFEYQEERKIWVSKHDNPLWEEWVKDMVFNAHDDMGPDDYKYKFIVDALETLSECETEEQADERRCEIEADIYTADLTAWLASNINRVYYLEEAIKNGATDGFSLLAMAQVQEKEEVFYSVLQAILKQLEA